MSRTETEWSVPVVSLTQFIWVYIYGILLAKFIIWFDMTSSIYFQVRLKALVSVNCVYDKYILHKLCLIGVTEKIGKESGTMSANKNSETN